MFVTVNKYVTSNSSPYNLYQNAILLYKGLTKEPKFLVARCFKKHRVDKYICIHMSLITSIIYS